MFDKIYYDNNMKLKSKLTEMELIGDKVECTFEYCELKDNGFTIIYNHLDKSFIEAITEKNITVIGGL